MKENKQRVSTIRRYWVMYGGTKALLTSLYFWAGVFLTIVMFPFWLWKPWWDTSLAILPNLLGFSLGGYAIFLAFSDTDFLKALSNSSKGKEGTPSYLIVSASFMHFLFVQVVALITSLIAKSYDFKLPQGWISECWMSTFNFFVGLGSGMGYLIFIYSILCGLAAAVNLFHLTVIYQAYNEQREP